MVDSYMASNRSDSFEEPRTKLRLIKPINELEWEIAYKSPEKAKAPVLRRERSKKPTQLLCQVFWIRFLQFLEFVHIWRRLKPQCGQVLVERCELHLIAGRRLLFLRHSCLLSINWGFLDKIKGPLKHKQTNVRRDANFMMVLGSTFLQAEWRWQHHCYH